ncbi:hypothetical protein FGLOB1_11039 [Fusarium globosum]|uniref:BTB domain-containing protein n=1 Tax=Fusarium globosum TaxID=78864 RepID=A0A8H5XV10_9HYPO|nr:hypothetical protein FGLOB1_11039 [Fusarium globosum]
MEKSKSRPLTTHALAWSCDAELAVATDDTIYIFLPEYPRSGGPDEGADEEELQSQYTLSYRASGLIRPDPTINAQLCSFSGIRVAGPPANDENWFPGVGNGLVTGSGAPICQIVSTVDQWMYIRDCFKAWKTLWGLGAQLPLPDSNEEDGYRNMNERIQAFSWAKEVDTGRGLLAYFNDVEEVAVMAVQHFSQTKEGDPSSEETRWDIQEVGRFDGRGRHIKEDALDITDPDYVPHGSAFSLKWSPWFNSQGKRVAILAYLAKNHVGFRKITILGNWERGHPPHIEVEKADMAAICMFLSTDAYIEWEDLIVYDDDKPVARGVVADPFNVKPFQVSFVGDAEELAGAHYTWECSTTYPKEDEIVSSNPISGLLIHDQGIGHTGSVPYYSIARLSATSRNQDWFQTNLPDSEASVPKWATRIRKQTTRLVARAVALEGLDSDSDDSEDDLMDEDTTQLQVPESRYRIWGMVQSPGGGTTAVLVSRYSTLHPERRALCKLMFSRRDEERGEDDTATLSKPLTTEGQVWEWMYGNAPEVLGTTATRKISPELNNSLLREQFRDVAAGQHCVFCDAALRLEEEEAKCENGHLFARCASTGLAIMAPDISRICAVCELRCLKVSELKRVVETHFGPGANVQASGEEALTYTMSASRSGAAVPAVSANFEESLASKPFLFVVGPEAKEFHIHKELIGRLSPVLNALVNGNMREAREGRVVWADLDVDTFVRFAKFAYSGDYSEAQPVLIREPELDTEDNHSPIKSYTRDGNGYASSSAQDSDDSRSTRSDSEEMRDDNDSGEDEDLDDDDDSSEDTPTGYHSPAGDGASPSEASTTVDRMSTRNGGNRPPFTYTYTYEYCEWKLPAAVGEFIQSYQSNNDQQNGILQLAEDSGLSRRKRRCPDQSYMLDVTTPIGKRFEAMRNFARPPYNSSMIRGGSPAVTSLQSTQEGKYSYLPVFLSHARLYILADKYGVEDLRRLSICRLHCILYYFYFDQYHIPDIVALAQELFENTVEDDIAREIIVEYFVCFIEYIRDTPEVKELLRKGGDFPVALVSRVAMRL